MKIRRYTIKHLSDNRKGHDSSAWADKGHTLTLIISDENDSSKDDLYVDHHHIHCKNWNYVYNRSQLVWKQDAQHLQPELLAGHIGFADGCEEGAGSMQFGEQREAVSVSYFHPSYSVDLSRDAGAYVTSDGLTLKWDTSSDTWKEATWDTNAMTFTYWIEKGPKIVDKQLYQTAVVFDDNRTKTTWDVLPRGPENSGAFSSRLTSDREFVFSVNQGYKPEAAQFPWKMAFQFDGLAQNITGGAMLCDHYSSKGTVLAMRGKANNPLVYGTYSLLSSEDGKEMGSLATHSGKLIIDGNKLESSSVIGNTLLWSGIQSPHLPSSGYAEFSEDGSKIIASSFAAVGSRNQATFAAKVYTSSLQLQDLLNMNPFEFDKDGKSVDTIQQSAMGDFYKFIQYYMPGDYLHDFIAPNPPDLGPELADIAKDSSANASFYESLAVPYLANALSLNTNNKNVVKLNARRAGKKLKKGISCSDVYKRHAAKLYSYRWQKKFPLMSQFLADQQVNRTTHNSAIDDDVAKWKAELQKDTDHTTDPKQLQKMLDIAENAASAGKSGKYWAYILFRYLTSPYYLTMLAMILKDGNTSQTLFQDITRYTSILSILDDTGFFAKEFADVANIFQLSGVLTMLIDIGGSIQDFDIFTTQVFNAFINKYVNSQDPQMSKEAKIVAEELKVHSLQDYLDVFNASAATLTSLADLAQTFKNNAIKKFGKIGGIVAKFLSMAAVATGILFLSTGVISWNELTPAQQTEFILSSVQLLVFLFRKGVEFYTTKVAAGWWEAIKVFFWKDVSYTSHTLNSTFGRWLIRNANAEGLDAAGIALEKAGNLEFEVAYPRLTAVFGRNMSEFMCTRFAALMSVVGIVLSAISLSNSKSPLEEAMNGLFLSSSILDLVAAVSSWVVASAAEAGGITIAGTFVSASIFTSIASIAGPLAIAGAIAGVIIMIVIMAKHKNPPDPVEKFVNSSAVKDEELYMEYETAVDYFEVIKDKDGKSRDIGVAISPQNIETQIYLYIHPDGSLSLHGLTYAYSTVLSLSVDEHGYCTFFTKVWNDKKESSVLSLTLDNNKELKMAKPITDSKKSDQQHWVITCKGNTKKNEKGKLLSANFVIYNVHWGQDYYLSSTTDGTSVTTGKSAKEWNFSMQGMKPEELTFDDITLSTYDRDKHFFPYLLQPGIDSGKSWNVNPTLPSWLKLNSNKGIISQASGVAPPKYSKTSFTITVNNSFGSASAGFYITVIST